MSLECDDDHYGIDCAEQCGMCSQGSACQKEDGVCLNGCQDGFLGERCTTAREGNLNWNKIQLNLINGLVTQTVYQIHSLCLFTLVFRKMYLNLRVHQLAVKYAASI